MKKRLASAGFLNFIKEKMEFDGIDRSEGLIAGAIDEVTVISDEVMTVENILTIRGSRLKIEAGDDRERRMSIGKIMRHKI